MTDQSNSAYRSQVEELVHRLTEAEDALQNLTGQIDAVLDPASGVPILLRAAQEALRRSYDELEQRVAERTAELAQANALLEQHVAERTAELQHSEARVRAIFEKAGLGIAVVDREGRLQQANPSLQEMLGYSQDALRGRSILGFVHEEDAGAFADAFDGVMLDGPAAKSRLEFRYWRHESQLRWATATVSVGRVNPETREFVIVMLDDITDEKINHQALLHADRLATSGRMAASLAHEILNPLQSAIGCLQLAEECSHEEKTCKYVGVALTELQRVTQLTRRLRDLGRLVIPGAKIEADLVEIVDSVWELASSRVESRRVEFQRQAEDGLPVVMGHPDELRQVVLNLVLNALDAMPDGGHLGVTVANTEEPRGVSISVSDTGCGIASDQIPRLFEPFYTTKGSGMGLGLYISQRIIATHDGRIDVESEPGLGSTFRVWLPAA